MPSAPLPKHTSRLARCSNSGDRLFRGPALQRTHRPAAITGGFPARGGGGAPREYIFISKQNNEPCGKGLTCVVPEMPQKGVLCPYQFSRNGRPVGTKTSARTTQHGLSFASPERRGRGILAKIAGGKPSPATSGRRTRPPLPFTKVVPTGTSRWRQSRTRRCKHKGDGLRRPQWSGCVQVLLPPSGNRPFSPVHGRRRGRHEPASQQRNR